MNQRQLGTMTVLFTDVVGSTAERRRLGDQSAEQLRERVDAIQTGVIDGHQGRVVKGTGDGVLAVFTSAGDALAAAGEIVARTHRLHAPGSVPIELRLGLSAGDVSQTDSDVFGTPVVEAARLCATAGGNEILLSEVVRLLAGSWAELPLVDRGAVHLRGLGSVQCWSLDWTGASLDADGGVGILVDEEFPFVGRAGELGALRDIWEGIARGERHAVLVMGEAGVGKSRLIVEAGRAIRSSGGLVLSGRCEEGVTAPLLPFHGIIDMYLREHDPATVRADAGPFLGELLRHFPMMASALGDEADAPDPDAETERWRLFSGLAHVIQSAAGRQSVALIIDDSQWADAATRRFIERMLREAGMRAVGLFITLREGEGDLGADVAAWLSRVERLPHVHRLDVAGLDAADLESLVAQSQVNVDVHDIWERTRGHPFFVSELVRYARASNGEAALVPRSVQDLLKTRLDRLTDATNVLLTVAAIAGSEFDVGTVGEVAGLAEHETLRAAEEAVRGRVLLEVPNRFDRFQFTHRLIADVITARTSTSRRHRLHRDYAKALERHGAAHAEIARHMVAAVPLVQVGVAVDVTRRAAQDAIARGSPDQAVSLLETALSLKVDPVTRIHLQLDVGSALNFGGHPAAAVPWFEQAATSAMERDQVDLLAQAALGCWAGNPWISNADQRAPKLLREALERCPPNDAVMRARLQAGLAAFSIFSAPLADRDRVTAEAVTLARGTGDPATLAATLASRHTAINCPLAIDGVELVDHELGAMAVEFGPAMPKLLDVPVASMPSLLVGVSSPQYWRADGEAYRAAADAFDLDDPRTPDWAATVGFQLDAGVAIFDGRLTQARDAADRAVAIGGWGDAGLGNHMWQRLVIDWLEGDVTRSLERVASLYEQFGGQPMRCTLAWVEAAAGNETVSRQLLERVRIERLGRLPELFLGTIALATCAMAVSHLGDRRWARAVISAFDPVAELVCGVPWTPLPAGRFFVGVMHTLLGDPSSAAAAFTEAATVHRRMQSPAFLALTQAWHARAIADADGDHSAELFAAATNTAARLGLAGVAALVPADH